MIDILERTEKAKRAKKGWHIAKPFCLQ